MNRAKCQGTTRTGDPCNATARTDSAWCPWHDPTLSIDRAAWRKEGGHSKSNVRRAAKRLPRDLQDVQTVLLRAVQGIEDGTFEPQRAQALSALARALCIVHEKGEIERRVAELETQLPPRTSYDL